MDRYLAETGRTVAVRGWALFHARGEIEPGPLDRK